MVHNILPSTFSTASASATLGFSPLNIPLHMIAVYASRPSSPAAPQHSLEGGTLLPYPRRTFTGWKAPASPGALGIAFGLDVSCRVALASTLDRGWHRTAAMGVIRRRGSCRQAAGLNVEQMVNALGIAFSQSAGNRQCIVDGALTKRLQAGQAASSGVFAALLAREGFTGAHDIFLGRFGFFQLYQPDGYDAAKLTEDLGRKFRGDELSFKPYACGRPQHAMLDAAIAARDQLRLGTSVDFSEIAEVTVTGPASMIDEQSSRHCA